MIFLLKWMELLPASRSDAGRSIFTHTHLILGGDNSRRECLQEKEGICSHDQISLPCICHHYPAQLCCKCTWLDKDVDMYIDNKAALSDTRYMY